MRFRLLPFFLLFLLSCTVACTKKTSTPVTRPAFCADSAYAFIAGQVQMGPRVPGTTAHNECAAYLIHTLERMGASVEQQRGTMTDFEGEELPVRNIIAHFGSRNLNNRILLAAHYDTRPWSDEETDYDRRFLPIDGANDGASGVGVLLEVARQLGLQQQDTTARMRGIDIVFFDCEDYGTPSFYTGQQKENTWCLGSQFWADLLKYRRETYQYGRENLIHVSEVDAICEIDRPYAKYEVMEPDDLSKQIAAHILKEIPDGATFQLGLGNISTAIGYGLHERNELGIHTELLNQPMLELMRSGNVTNTRKGYMDGKTVFSFTFGNPDLYEALDHNEQFYVVPFHTANDPRIICQNRNMMSINATMSLNLFGEAASECVAWKQYSAVGGQLDFVRGAQWSEGGKSFIATTSSFMKNGKRVSKIVPFFAPGTPVTTPRSDIQYVATEFGCVNLKVLNMDDRARAIISIAHPDFREELTEQAKKVGLIR